MGGLGEACYFVFSSQLVIKWFPHNRYFAVGVTSAGAAAGGLAYPQAIFSLINGYGFNNGVRIQSGIIGAISVIILIFGSPLPTSRRIELGSLLKMNNWVDRTAVKCRPYMLLTASTSFIFFGYSPLRSGVAHIIPANRQDSLDVWTGMLWSSCCFLALAGPPVSGALREKFSIEAVGYWTGANLLVAGTLSTFAMLTYPMTDDTKQSHSEPGEDTSLHDMEHV